MRQKLICFIVLLLLTIPSFCLADSEDTAYSKITSIESSTSVKKPSVSAIFTEKEILSKPFSFPTQYVLTARNQKVCELSDLTLTLLKTDGNTQVNVNYYVTSLGFASAGPIYIDLVFKSSNGGVLSSIRTSFNLSYTDIKNHQYSSYSLGGDYFDSIQFIDYQSIGGTTLYHSPSR